MDKSFCLPGGGRGGGTHQLCAGFTTGDLGILNNFCPVELAAGCVQRPLFRRAASQAEIGFSRRQEALLDPPIFHCSLPGPFHPPHLLHRVLPRRGAVLIV